MLDHATNTILAKRLRTDSDGLVRLQLEERTEEVVLKAGFGPSAGQGEAKEITVLTDVSMDDSGIYFKRKRILAWVVRDDEDYVITLADCKGT